MCLFIYLIVRYFIVKGKMHILLFLFINACYVFTNMVFIPLLKNKCIINCTLNSADFIFEFRYCETAIKMSHENNTNNFKLLSNIQLVCILTSGTSLFSSEAASSGAMRVTSSHVMFLC